MRSPRWMILTISLSVVLCGCHRSSPHRAAVVTHLTGLPLGADPLPLQMESDRLPDSIVDSLHKRIMGRYVSLQETQRVEEQVRPLVISAASQPSVQPMLARIARDEELSVRQARQRWIDLQEADLLLESGGDAEAVSPAEAGGVAQWLASTARGVGLAVDSEHSVSLTRGIEELDREIAWLNYLREPGANPALPGAPRLSGQETEALLQKLSARRTTLCRQRRAIDARFDPRSAIFAQTRYLMRIYPLFPGIDWLFQAYHGGEGGVRRMLKSYAGVTGSVNAAELIAHGDDGHRLSYERLYLTVSPRSHPEAFHYLYGRSDDDRHYWWKLRASETALAEYRAGPAAFQSAWTALLPGRRTEALWYPDGPADAVSNIESLRAALHDGVVTPVTATTDFEVRAEPLDPYHASDYAALRPETKGALLLTAAIYRKAGGADRLMIGDLMLTPPLAAEAKTRYHPLPTGRPPWPPGPGTLLRPGGGPPADFDYHATGLVFDILRPADPKQDRILQYALGWLEDRQIVAVIDAKDNGERRYHICANPRFGRDLARMASVAGSAPQAGASRR